MKLVTRLKLLEQRNQNIDITESNHRLRELIGKHLGLDLIQCIESDFEGYIKSSLRLCITEAGQVYGDDWTTQRLRHELSGILYRAKNH